MTKAEFISALRARLSGLPEADIDRSADYYSEMIDDCVEDGMSEEAAVASLGPLDDIVSQILMDTPLPRLVKARVKPSGSLQAWQIVLIVLGAPVWLGLLVAAVSIIFSVYGVIWSIAFSLFVVTLTLGVTAIALICGSVTALFLARPLTALAVFGTALFLAGTAILMFLGSVALAKLFVKLGRCFILAIKSCFIKKESNK